VESENRQSWLLIAIAALGLVLGAIALVIAFDAKSSGDDSASKESVAAVDAKLTLLIDRLGIAEKSLTGEQENLKGKAKRAQRESQSVVTNLSNRLDKLERKTKALEASQQSTANLSKRVGSLEDQVGAIDSRVTALNQRVTKLSRRVNDSGAAASGGESAP
jgi:chromosome segregation ATPase